MDGFQRISYYFKSVPRIRNSYLDKYNFSYQFSIEPGTVEFTKASNIYKESSGIAEIEIQRMNGADGQIAVKWTTTDQSAVSGKDYHGGEGTVVFEHGETVKILGIELIDDKTFEKDETFMVTLSDATNGAKVGRLRRTVVTIVNDDG